jgi:hypothetical protein
MRPRRQIVFGLCLAITTVLAASLWYAYRPRPVLLVQNYTLVRNGLTQAEVEHCWADRLATTAKTKTVGS